MIDKKVLLASLKDDKEKKQELVSLAEEVAEKLETAEEVLEFIDILTAIVKVQGLVL